MKHRDNYPKNLNDKGMFFKSSSTSYILTAFPKRKAATRFRI